MPAEMKFFYYVLRRVESSKRALNCAAVPESAPVSIANSANGVKYRKRLGVAVSAAAIST